MHLDWLEDFLALAKTGNFSLAAEVRNTTQPAFSRRIRRLEDWVGETLIDRSNHPVQLTGAGRSFQAEAEAVLERLAAARARAAHAARAERETVLFAATHMLATEFFPAWLERLPPGRDRAQSRLNCHSVPRCFEELAAGHVDFMLCPIPHAPRRGAREWEQHDYLVAGRDRMVPVSVPDAAGRPQFAIRPDPPARLPLLALAESSVLGSAVTHMLASRGAQGMFDIVFESPLKEAVRAMALKGHGIAWLPESSVARELQQGALVPAGDGGWSVGYDIRCYRKAGALTDGAERFWQAAQHVAAGAGA